MKNFFVIAIIALCIIAIASSMTYDQQSLIPFLKDILADKPFEDELSHIAFTYHGSLVSIEEDGYYHFIEFFIRKGTHFFGFGITAVIFYSLYKRLRLNFAGVIAITTIFVIACIDELHQSFVDGRTGIFTDVLLDTCGAIFCVVIVKLVHILHHKKTTTRS